MLLNSITDIGVKRSDNQDNFWSMRGLYDDKELGVICLCDGMGGLDDGALASSSVVSCVKEFISSGEIELKDLEFKIKEVNRDLYFRSKKSSKSLGTTCTILLCFDGDYHILHVGDSRCYRIRGSEVTVLTDDHTVINKYKKEGRELPPHLVKKYKNMLTRCIGVSDRVELDYYVGTYSSDDTFLVCSDGFWHTFESKLKNTNLDLTGNLEVLVKECISNGETDNITVSILKV